MAIVSTKAIVLSSLKYSDSSLIVKCYTEKEGLKSYLIRGVLKAKKGNIKAAYFQQLTQLQIIATHKPTSNLNTLKEVHIVHPYKTIYTDIVKQSVVLFLSEVLSKTIQEEEENLPLYSFLETAFIWLDTHEKISNFHLLFLLNLTKFLGFYPDLIDKEKLGFNLMEGRFTDATHEKLIITGNNLTLLKKLLGINFDAIEKVSFSKHERQQILQMIIRYFELHLDGFKSPKSLDILKVVFS
ncbi:DNA replication and repair protein RecO [Lutibacter sp. Hel_I_33_5]|uniref:DNA repair protein RecO n=1 Tax=Lutibacter sp. Hel_I_33_5 TaxID=1566289 RepID=UPI00119CC300|nr:DNA repair protein RecO [Lutibacter sp. Hel_I_33_5]TVZ56214.1 DNA replication and repair protein RecO [Lutibacter sp. Hel_I_33_5]